MHHILTEYPFEKLQEKQCTWQRYPIFLVQGEKGSLSQCIPYAVGADNTILYAMDIDLLQ